jgi:putative peptidoglycan lipid II flippase
VTAVLAVVAVPSLHVYAIAAANGAGITTTAVLLLVGLRKRIVAVSLPVVGSATARIAFAAAGAGLVGWLAGRWLPAGWPAFVEAAAGGVVVLAVFVVLARLAGVDEVTNLVRKVYSGH